MLSKEGAGQRLAGSPSKAYFKTTPKLYRPGPAPVRFSQAGEILEMVQEFGEIYGKVGRIGNGHGRHSGRAPGWQGF